MKMIIAQRSGETVERILNIKSQQIQVFHAQNHEQLSFMLSESDTDTIFVHCELFVDVYPWDWMNEIKSKLPLARVFIVLDSTVYDAGLLAAVERLAIDYSYYLLPVGTTGDDIFQRLSEELFPDSNRSNARKTELGKVVTVFGAAAKDGATTVAINTAIALASKTDLRVGLLDLNLKNPEIRSNLDLSDREKSNLKLRPRLQTGDVTPTELLETCHSNYKKLSKLHVLAGTPRRDTAHDVTPEMVQHLLNVARETFDVTIIDVNCYPDNAATICAVRSADLRWLIVQNNFASFKTSWGEWYECYWRHCGITPQDLSLIVNRVIPQNDTQKVDEIVGIPLLKKLPNVSNGLGVKAVHEGLPLYYHSEAKAFIEQIDALAEIIIGQEGSIVGSATKRSGLSGFLSKVASIF